MSINNSTFNIPTWTTVITAVSIPSTIAVYGNGKTIGLTNGTTNFCLCGPGGAYSWVYSYTTGYNTNVNSTGSSGNGVGGSYGVVSDTTGKSGIVAKSNSITRTSKSFKFCIKY